MDGNMRCFPALFDAMAVKGSPPDRRKSRQGPSADRSDIQLLRILPKVLAGDVNVGATDRKFQARPRALNRVNVAITINELVLAMIDRIVSQALMVHSTIRAEFATC